MCIYIMFVQTHVGRTDDIRHNDVTFEKFLQYVVSYCTSASIDIY